MIMNPQTKRAVSDGAVSGYWRPMTRALAWGSRRSATWQAAFGFPSPEAEETEEAIHYLARKGLTRGSAKTDQPRKPSLAHHRRRHRFPGRERVKWRFREKTARRLSAEPAPRGATGCRHRLRRRPHAHGDVAWLRQKEAACFQRSSWRVGCPCSECGDQLRLNQGQSEPWSRASVRLQGKGCEWDEEEVQRTGQTFFLGHGHAAARPAYLEHDPTAGPAKRAIGP